MTKTDKSIVTVTQPKDGIALVTLDTPGSSANVLTEDLFEELDSTFASLQKRTDLKGVILYSAKPKIFVAGADLKRIWRTLDWPDEKIIQFCEDGRRVMARLSQMNCPTVAAIHGACLGGGLEITLWCDYRIATNERRTILGLPEVKLGLVPGWAGTVRLPRLAGLKPSLEMVTSGQPVTAEAAMKMGFVDQLSSFETLTDDTVAFIENLAGTDAHLERRKKMQGPVDSTDAPKPTDLVDDFSKSIASNPEIYSFAPEVVLQHVIESAEMNHDEAAHSESLAMAKVYGSDPSYGLLNCFFLSDHNKKKPGQVDTSIETKPITTVGIIGAGLMGSSIAQISSSRGQSVRITDASPAALESAMQRLDPERVTLIDDFSPLADSDFVIESVVETKEVKLEVLEKIEAAVSDETVIASNTSAIPIGDLANGLKNPERFCGVHFCHPELMSLVEVIGGPQTSPKTLATAVAWVRSLRKMPVAVSDGPGFVVNRLLAAMLDQAVRLYGWGYSVETIDAAVREFGFQGGPFEIVDIVGVETCLFAGRSMLQGKINCVSMSPVLPRMVNKGWLGRKSGQGFYTYESFTAEGKFDPEVDNLLSKYVDASNRPELNANQIAESIMCAIVLEASYLLDDGMVNDPRDIDLCIIHGFSFPQHHGGILFWADRFGIGKVIEQLQMLEQYDKKLAPNERLRNMDSDDVKFYS